MTGYDDRKSVAGSRALRFIIVLLNSLELFKEKYT